MRKLFIVALAVLLTAGVAYAVDTDFSGMINTRGTYFSNDTGFDEDAYAYSTYDMELDADLKIMPSDKTLVFLNFEIHDEDFGQTFGHWGMGNGFYIVWPILGPSTLRDSIGLVGEPFLTPYYYVKPGEVYYELWTLNKTNTISFQIGDYESLKEASLDPYQAFRNAYIQYRNDQVAK